MNKIILIIVTVIIILIGALGFVFIRNRNVIEAQSVTPQKEIVIRTVSANGTVKSDKQAILSFAGGGKVANINKTDGDLVTQGERLASLNVISQLESANAIKDSRDLAIRNKDLFLEQNKNTDQDEEYRIRLRLLDEQISQAERNYKAALAGISDLNIRSPFGGTVVDVLKKEGENASPFEPILIVADLNELYFEVEINQEDIGLIQQNQRVIVSLDAYENESFEAYIDNIPGYAITSDFGEQIFKVKIKFDNPQKPILLGMTGDAKIIVESSIVEVTSLDFDVINFDEQDKPYVWTVDENNLLKKYDIETGIEGDITTEVKSELDSVNIILIDNNSDKTFTEGLKVKLSN